MKRLAIGGGLALGALALYLLNRNFELVEITTADHAYMVWQPAPESAHIQESGK